MATETYTLYCNPDYSRLGEAATPSDLEGWEQNLKALLEEEFECQLHLVNRVVSNTYSDNEEISNRVRQICETDEWIELLP